MWGESWTSRSTVMSELPLWLWLRDPCQPSGPALLYTARPRSHQDGRLGYGAALTLCQGATLSAFPMTRDGIAGV